MQHAACGSCCHRPQQPWPRPTKSAVSVSRGPTARHVVCALPARLAERHANKEAGRAAVAEEKAKGKGKLKGKGGQGQQQSAATPAKGRKPGLQWNYQGPPATSRMLDFVPGRDAVYPPQTLKRGMDAYDRTSGQHVLWSTTMPPEAAAQVEPLALRGLQLFESGQLPRITDGRASAGPVDLVEYLAQPEVQQQVDAAIQRRGNRLRVAGQTVPRARAMLQHVVHVSTDQRKVLIGDEADSEAMNSMKNWRSAPIQTWLGGLVADVPGPRASELVPSDLSVALQYESAGLAAAANILWDELAANPTTADAARRMLAHAQSSPARDASRIGRTPWNAYAYNIDFRTGPHADSKNVEGSYSALLVVSTGQPFCGSYYMLPQYHAALDVRPDVVVFHRSGDSKSGLHGNSALWRPTPESHRIAIVLYQTEVKVPEGVSVTLPSSGADRYR